MNEFDESAGEKKRRKLFKNKTAFAYYMAELCKRPAFDKERQMELLAQIPEVRKHILRLICSDEAIRKSLAIRYRHAANDASGETVRALLESSSAFQKMEIDDARKFCVRVSHTLTDFPKKSMTLDALTDSIVSVRPRDTVLKEMATTPETDVAVQNLRNIKNDAVESALGLVVFTARSMAKPGQYMGDLVSSGNLGLIRAVELYEERRNSGFAAYAVKCIEGSILNDIYNTKNTVRLPTNIYDLKRKIYKAQASFRKENGRSPTAQELSELLNTSLGQIRALHNAPQHKIELDANWKDSADGIERSYTDKATIDPHSFAEHMQCSELLEYVLRSLTPRQERVLQMRFGLNGSELKYGDELSLDEVGQWFMLTRQRVGQIEAKALRRMRTPQRSRQLRPLI